MCRISAVNPEGIATGLCCGVGLWNSNAFLKEKFEQVSPSELVRKDNLKAER
jgi:hypothetical protein